MRQRKKSALFVGIVIFGTELPVSNNVQLGNRSTFLITNVNALQACFGTVNDAFRVLEVKFSTLSQ